VKTRRAALLVTLALLGLVPCRGDRAGEPAALPFPAADGAGLWQKALNIYRSNQDWYPERISILSEVLDRHEQPYSVTQLDFSLRLDADGRMRTELTRALKNGEDTTEKMRAKVEIRSPQDGMDPEKEESYSVSISDSPFNPERQGFVTVQANGERRILFGHACRRFDFSYRTSIFRKGQAEELTWIGMAWLEEGSGMPVKLEFSLDPMPRRIRSLWTIYLYDTAQPDKWVVNKVKITGHGGFLFIKKYFRSTTIFSQYRRQAHLEGEK
jgi:hypothetical protein